MSTMYREWFSCVAMCLQSAHSISFMVSWCLLLYCVLSNVFVAVKREMSLVDEQRKNYDLRRWTVWMDGND